VDRPEAALVRGASERTGPRTGAPRAFLFVFRVSPDIDHMSPLVWKLLEEGERVHVVLSPGYDPGDDHRLALLRTYARFTLHHLWPPSDAGGVRSVLGYLRSSLPYALALLARERVQVVAVEWGYGLRPAYDELWSLAGLTAVLRSLVRSIIRASEPWQTRSNFLVAARLLGLPMVCLPHGLNIKHGTEWNDDWVRLMKEGPVDYLDRNRFTAYILNTEEMRDWHIDHAMGDPEIMEALGSLRWSPEWFELNRRLAPPFEWPGESENRVRVLFMVPKWANRVRAEETLELVRRLQEQDEVSLAVMGHPRKSEGGTDPLRADPRIDWSRIHDVSGVNSVSAIGACDVVVDVGSSIGIEVVMQGKVLVNPTYLHEMSTFFDTIEGAAVVARGPDGVVAYLEGHARGSRHETEASSYDALMRQAVYANRPEPFDVLEAHRRRLTDLATDGPGVAR